MVICCNMNGMFVTKESDDDDDEQYWKIKDDGYISEEIGYCPFCGKKLD